MTFPGQFLSRIREQSGIDANDLLKALGELSPVSIRLNPLKWDKTPLYGKEIPWCKEGWYLENRPSFTLDPLFHAGCYYPQEASGMFIGNVFRQIMPAPEDIRVLDLCGAPGGKSTHLASLTGSKGVLITNEVIRSRASVLEENIARWGIANVMVSCNDPSAFSSLGEYFDIIAVDAPCSGEGMFRDKVALKEWSESNTILCSERQKRIIIDIWPSLRRGGYLIYSTCTFNPEENEKNIKWLLDNRKGKSIQIDISRFEGIKEIDYEGISGYGFYPGRIKGEGLFLSVVKKEEETKGSLKSRKQVRGNTAREARNTDFRFLNREVPLILREADNLIAVPLKYDEFRMLNQRLNIIRKGTLICNFKGDDLIPSPEIALSELLSGNAFPVTELDYTEAISFLRKDNIKIPRVSEGWSMVSYKGVGLGFIKNIGTRINNYYPVAWRIRMQAPGNEKMIIDWMDQYNNQDDN